jgi:IS30 family transposase
MHKQLTCEERDCLAQSHAQGFTQQEIAAKLNRHKSTISRELRRNRTGEHYYAGQAHQAAQRRRCERPLKRKMDDSQLNEFVRHGLAQSWSPEQIAHRLEREQKSSAVEPRRCISAPTIYQWIESSEHREHWRSFLRRRGKRPVRPKKPEIACAARIANRPDVIEERIRIGDFEGDTVLGPPGTGGIVTLVDRKSRLTIITKIHSKDADHVHQRIKLRLQELAEEQRRSITFDNGTEFARCERLEKHLAMKLYYADPGCPYQRGTNENTNGLIRQFFPKGTEFKAISHQDVRRVEKLLNNRPRKCLQWRTPHEVFHEEVKGNGCD